MENINFKLVLDANQAEKEALNYEKVLKNIDTTLLTISKKMGTTFNKGASSQNAVREATARTNNTFRTQSRLLSQLKTQFGVYFSIYEAQRFVKQMAKIRGEFELQGVALTAMLQDKALADQMFTQVTAMAMKSPFRILEMNKYLKQLKAYRIENKNLIGTLKMLGDVSAGLGVSMDRLILAYGQVRAASVLRGQELRQFTEAGIPLVAQLADKFTELRGEVVSTGDVFKLISERQVPFEMIRDIFVDMTKKGGIFYNQQEIQASTLSGQISILKDAFDKMYNSMGKDNEAILKGGIKSIRYLIDNYKTVLDILKALITTYGIYKISMLASIELEKGYTLAMIARYRIMLLIERLNKTMAFIKTNPYAIALTAIAAVTTALIVYYRAQKRVNQEQILANKINKETNERVTRQTVGVSILIEKLKLSAKNSEERNRLISEANEKYPDLLRNIDAESASISQLDGAYQSYFDTLESGVKTDVMEKHFGDAVLKIEDIQTKIKKITKEYNSLSKEDEKTKKSPSPYKYAGGSSVAKYLSDLNAQLLILEKQLKIQEKLKKTLKESMIFESNKLAYGEDYANLKKRQKSTLNALNDIEKKIALNELNLPLTAERENELLKEQVELVTELKKITAEIDAITHKTVEDERRWVKLTKEKAAERGGGWDITTKKYEPTEGEDFVKYAKRILKARKELEDKLNYYKESYKTRLKDTTAETLDKEKKEIKHEIAVLKSVADYWKWNFGGGKTFKISDVNKQAIDELKAQLRLLKEMRVAREKLDEASKKKHVLNREERESFEKAFNKDEFKKAFENLDIKTDMFDAFSDEDYKKTLDKVITKAIEIASKIKPAGKKVGDAFVTAIKEAVESELSKDEIGDASENLMKEVSAIELKEKWLKELAPFGKGFVINITAKTTEADKKIAELKETLKKVLSAADITPEQTTKVTNTFDRKVKAINESTKKSIASLVEATVKGQLGNLEQFYTNINKASLIQLLKVDKKMKEMSKIKITPLTIVTPEELKKLDLSKDKLADVLDLLDSGFSMDKVAEKYDLTDDQVKILQKLLGETDAWNEKLKETKKNWKNLSDPKKFNKLAKDIQTVGGSVVSFGNALSELGKAQGDAKLEELGKEIAITTDLFVDATSAAANFAAQNYPEAIANVVDLVSKIITEQARAAQELRDAQEKLEQETYNARKEYNAWINETILGLKYVYDEFGNLIDIQSDLFGTANPFSGAISGANAYRDTLKNLTGDIYKVSNIKTWEDFMAVVYGQRNPYKNVSLGESLTETGKMQTDTKQKSSWFGLVKKTVPVYSSLADTLDVDKIDVFSDEQLHKALANYDKLDDATKRLVDDWKEYRDEIDESLDQINENITNVSGNIAGDFGDAVVDAFKNGADAADLMKDSVEGVVEAMLQQMMVTTFLAPAFDKLQKKMYASMGLLPNGKIDPNAVKGMGAFDENWADDFGSWWENEKMPDLIDNMKGFLQESKDKFKKDYGLDLWETDKDAKGLSKGIQSITEDTANIIAAYLNTIRFHVILNTDYMRNMMNSLQQTRNISAQQLTKLSSIEAHTLRTAQILEDVVSGVKMFKVA